MPRPRFTLPCKVSLILLAITLALAIWSFWRPHVVFGQTTPAPAPAHYREVGLYNGHLAFSIVRTFPPPPNLGGGYPYGANSSRTAILGVALQNQRTTLLHPQTRTTIATVADLTSFSVSLFLPLILFSLLPALWLLRHWKYRRTPRAGTCLVCGYDLRASKDRCPECGTPVAR